VDTNKLVTKLLDGITESGWKDALYDALRASDKFRQLALFLYEEEMAGKKIYPPHPEIFTALNLCPIDTVKVIILGQDPYHRYGQGHGLAFSVRKSVRPPPSLQNIFKELVDDIGIDGESIMHGNLSAWAKRGVLLLNTVLTVREGEALSHANKGWEEVANTILRIICERNSMTPLSSASDDIPSPPRGNGLVVLLWGNAAIQTMDNVMSSFSNKHTIHIIKTSHPSPLGATKTKSPFLGSKCFSRTNQALIDMGHDPIDWSVE
jgi:uracil-DNA glycosylase